MILCEGAPVHSCKHEPMGTRLKDTADFCPAFIYPFRQARRQHNSRGAGVVAGLKFMHDALAAAPHTSTLIRLEVREGKEK
eukprot:scaffold193787_cov17-Tisochrysis_lutea.AAC.1